MTTTTETPVVPVSPNTTPEANVTTRTITTIPSTNSITTVLSDQFPAIELGHELYATRSNRKKNWKDFFSKLTIGAVFFVEGGPAEANKYYLNGYARNIILSRKRQPGGSYRMQRVR